MEPARVLDGSAVLEAMRKDAPTAVLDAVAEIAPDFRDYIHGFVYGEVFVRPGLEPRDRLIITLSCLVMTGGLEGPIEMYVDMCLNEGMPPYEIVEVILQCVSLAGFPRVQSALMVARSAFTRRGVLVERPAAT